MLPTKKLRKIFPNSKSLLKSVILPLLTIFSTLSCTSSPAKPDTKVHWDFEDVGGEARACLSEQDFLKLKERITRCESK